MSNQFTTREQWLVAAVEHLQSQVFGKVGLTIPTDVKVSCSFPSAGGLGKKRRTIGQCWARSASDANVNEVFISPTLDDSVLVLDVLVGVRHMPSVWIPFPTQLNYERTRI